LHLEACQFAIYVDLDSKHNRPAADITVLNVFLVPARGVDLGLEYLAAIGALYALQTGHGSKYTGIYSIL
jgi:hypothetical protein